MSIEAKSELVTLWRSAMTFGAFMTAAVWGLWQDVLGLDAYQAFVREHWVTGPRSWIGNVLLAGVAIVAVWQCGRSVVRLRRHIDATEAAERIVERSIRDRLRAVKETGQ